jgi:hypothetical protein
MNQQLFRRACFVIQVLKTKNAFLADRGAFTFSQKNK